MIHTMYDPSTEPVITPEMIYGQHEKICDNCFLTFSSVIFNHVCSTFPCHEVAAIPFCGGSIPILKAAYKGLDFLIYLSPIGSAMAGTCIQEASCLTGATRFFLFGSAGCLNREKTAGKYVVPQAAYRDEGFSFHYVPESDEIDMPNAAWIAEAFGRLQVPCVLGKTWTTDAIYRETRGKMEKRKAEGCLTVEMECAGTQAVCHAIGAELYAFLQCGDVLDLPDWEQGEIQAANHDLDKLYLALQLAKLLEERQS